MKKHIQISVVSIAFIVTLVFAMQFWKQIGKNPSEAEEINKLAQQISPLIKPNTQLSFISIEQDINRIIFFDYALLALAPKVITDDKNKNDSLVSIDIATKFKGESYKNYTCIKKVRNRKYIMQLLVKNK